MTEDTPRPPVGPQVPPVVAAPTTAPTTLSSPYPAPPTPPARRGMGLLGTVLVAAVVAAVVGAFAGVAGYALGRSLGSEEAVVSAEPAAAGEAAPQVIARDGSIAEIAADTLPAVVSLVVDGSSGSGSGSGFVIRSDGYILTNNHVVSVASDGSVEVVFADGERRPGRVIGTSPSYDLAVVKVDRSDLPTLALGNSDEVRVGDIVVAIGAPLGLDGTVTSGIVSALDRPVMAGESASDVSYINAVQTDAAINPGNSGGPLLDRSGNVIGVNSAIATLAIGGEAGSIGLGFAIPSNSASRVAEEIIATGSSRTPLMGVQLDPAYTDGGARVSEITPGSGAEAAGLRTGDIVREIDSRPIEDSTELVVAIRSYAPGDTISVTFERGGRTQQADLVLGDDSRAG
jgi:putative serine protease PepD